MRRALLLLPFLAGCATTSPVDNPPMRPGGPNWEEIDKSVQRIKDREKNKPRLVETARHEEQGFARMTDEDYASVLDAARVDVRKANPKMSDADIETEATKRADQAKRDYERSFSRSAGSTLEWKRPEDGGK